MRISGATGSPSGAADDFGLSWIRDRVGPDEVRRVVVLACAGGPIAPEPAFIDWFRAVVERFEGLVRVEGNKVFAVWGIQRESCQDTRLAGFAGLALADTCDVDFANLRFGVHCTRIPAVEGAELAPEKLLDAAVKAESIANVAPNHALAASKRFVGIVGDAFEVEPVLTSIGGVVDGVSRLDARGLDFHGQRLNSLSVTIGRAEERNALDGAWRSVRDGGGSRIVVVTGEAGIGKSTLVRFLMEDVVAEGGFTVMAGCAPGSKSALMTPTDTNQLLAAVGRLRQRAKGRPGVAAVEDIEWADRNTIEFIAHNAIGVAGADGTGLLLIVTARHVPPWLEAVPFEEVRVGFLEDDAMNEILNTACLGGGLDDQDWQRLIACAGGNPLVALELGRVLSANPDKLDWQKLRRPSGGSGRVSDMLPMRLAALGALRHVARAAAIFPDQFEATLLAEMLAVGSRWLKPRLADLEEAGILARNTGRRGDWYQFSHRLLRDAAYDSIVPHRQQVLHLRAALALASRAPTDLYVDPTEIAEHFSMAGHRRDAFAWLQRAAEKAAGQQEPRAAVAHLQQALDVAGHDAGEVGPLAQIEALRQLGVSLIQVKGSAGPEVRAIFERALALCDSTPGVPGQLHFDLLWGLDAFLLAGGEVREAQSRGEQMLNVAELLGDRQRIMLARRMHAVSLLLAGRLNEAIQLYLGALAVYDEAQDSRLRFEWASDQAVVAHAHLCWAFSITGDFHAADRHMRLALAVARKLDHAHSTAHALGVLATAAQIRGDRGAAGAFAVAARALAEHNGFPYWTAWCDMVSGWVAGNDMPEDGLMIMRLAIDDYRRTGAGQALPYALLLLADASLRRGDPRRALDAVEAAREASRGGIMLWNSMIYRVEASARLQLGGDRRQVDRLFREGRRIALSQGAYAFAEQCQSAFDSSQRSRKSEFGLA